MFSTFSMSIGFFPRITRISRPTGPVSPIINQMNLALLNAWAIADTINANENQTTLRNSDRLASSKFTIIVLF